MHEAQAVPRSGGLLRGGHPAFRADLRSPAWVERFGRRGTEQNELLRSEFGENSCKIQEFSLENLKNSEN